MIYKTDIDTSGNTKHSLAFYLLMFLLAFAAINAFAIFFLFSKYN